MLLAAVAALGTAHAANAPAPGVNDTCLMCHGDNSKTHFCDDCHHGTTRHRGPA